jgi:hypothetical protein
MALKSLFVICVQIIGKIYNESNRWIDKLQKVSMLSPDLEPHPLRNKQRISPGAPCVLTKLDRQFHRANGLLASVPMLM